MRLDILKSAVDRVSQCEVTGTFTRAGLTTLQVVVLKCSIRWMSDVARNNKIRADMFSIRQSAKRVPGDRRKKRDVALNVGEWNVRIFMGRSAS